MKRDFERIINELPIAVVVFNEEQVITYGNDTLSFFPEIVSKNVIGKPLSEAFSFYNDFKREFDNLARLLPFEIQVNNTEKLNGQPISVIVKAVPFQKNGEFVGGLLAIEDITVMAETSGIEIFKTELFKELTSLLGMDFYLTNKEGEVFLAYSKKIKNPKNFIANNFSEFLRGNGTVKYQDRVYEFTVAPFPKKITEDEIFVVAAKEITEKHNRYEALEKELEELKAVVNETQAVLYYDNDGKIEKAFLPNEYESVFPNVAAGKKVSEIIPDSEKENLFAGNSLFYFSLPNREKRRYFKARVFELNKKYVLTLTEITDDMDKAAEFSGIYENFELFLNNSDDFVWKAERVGGKLKQTYYTPNVEKIIGYRPDELLGSNLLWYRIIHPNDRKKVVDVTRQALASEKNAEFELEFRVVTKNHSIVWVREKLRVIFNESNALSSFVGTVSDITKTKEKEEKILKENRKLKEINEAKDRFISIISHDLRSPFSSILGFTKLLLEQNLPEDKAKEYVSYIQNSAESMLNLVNALLDWTRLQTGRIKFTPAKTALHEVVKSSVEMLLGSAMQKGVELLWDVPEDIFVHGDKNLLLQVFGNLLGNAIKFTRKGDKIIVRAEKDESGKFIKVSVKDTGVGIRKEDLPKLFKVDTKFTNPGTAGEKGTGLGLSLVHEIVKKHGGEIKVESEYGKGTEFIFTLMVSSSVVLLVDGNPTELVLYSKLVKSLYPELKISTAANLEELRRKIAEKSPVLIITETELEGADIFQLLEEFGKSQGIAPKVIVLSRKIDRDTKEKLEKEGIKNVFGKPVDLTLFRAAIANSLKN